MLRQYVMSLVVLLKPRCGAVAVSSYVVSPISDRPMFFPFLRCPACMPTLLLLGVWQSAAEAQSTASFPDENAEAEPAPSEPARSPSAPPPPPATPPAGVGITAPGVQSSQVATASPGVAAQQIELPANPPPLQVDPLGANWPTRLPYREGDAVLAGYHVEHRSNSGLSYAGGLLLTATYGASIVVAAGQDFDNGLGWLMLPAVGPWLAMLGRRVPCKTPTTTPTSLNDVDTDCSNKIVSEARTLSLLLIDGLLQTAATGLFIAGLASSESFLILDSRRLRLGLVPDFPRTALGRAAYGAAIQGVF